MKADVSHLRRFNRCFTQRIGVLPTNELISPLQRILFPSFSEIAKQRDRLRDAVRESVNVLGSVLVRDRCRRWI